MKSKYHLDWDSEFFNMYIARLVILQKGELEMLGGSLQALQDKGYNLVYVFLDLDLAISAEILGEYKGELVDEKVVYKIGLDDFDLIKPDENIAPAMEMSEDLIELSIQSGVYSRFNRDVKFGEDNFKKLYRTWIEKSFTREIADEVLIYKINGVILGMITIIIKGSNAEIGLVAVSNKARGKRIGSKLLDAVKVFCLNRNVLSIEVATQLLNRQACSFYEKNNFILGNVKKVYHFWLDK